MSAGPYTLTVAYPIQGEQVYVFHAREIVVEVFLSVRDDDEFPAILTFPHRTPAGPVGQAQKG